MRERERRYTRKELVAILDAADTPVPPAATAVPRRGLSLDEVQAIAGEVGVPAAAVARAARQLPLESEGELAHLLGGSPRMQFVFSTPGALDPASQERLLEAARRVTGEQGSFSRAGSALEWRTGGLAVNVVSGAGETRVHIIGDRRDLASIVAAVSTIAAGVTIGVSGAILEPTGFVPIASLVVGIAAAAAVTGRALWARSTARFHRTVRALTDAIAEALERGHSPAE